MSKPIEVWVAMPSCNPVKASATNRDWKRRGYRTAFLLNGKAREFDLDADLIVRDEYLGWGNSINHLCKMIDAPIVVGAGDDMTPDPRHRADEIAAQFIEHFGGTFGVMQPTGDRWGDSGDGTGALADRICGSPWLGREFIERWNGGNGPFWHGYFHFYADEELKVVTERAGILWQRLDLTHHHDHWMRTPGKRPDYMLKPQQKWNDDQTTFRRRFVAGFPDHEPIRRSTYTPPHQASPQS